LAISTKIFVGNLSFSMTRQELTDLLGEAGRVIDVRLPTDRETGKPRGFAFVEFAGDNEAADAIQRFNNREVGGRRLKVNAAEDRPIRPAGFRPPGGAGGGMTSAPPDFGAPFDDPFDRGGGAGKRPFKNKGSRRGMRGRKRSLNY
jgi:RNA recognition motif-containing protein